MFVIVNLGVGSLREAEYRHDSSAVLLNNILPSDKPHRIDHKNVRHDPGSANSTGIQLL